MNVIGLSYLAGYEIVNTNTFRLNGFVGFGLQARFRNRHINSYGYNFQSDMYVLNDNQQLIMLVPMLNAGIQIGIKTGGKKND
jgi:hypothetical protein